MDSEHQPTALATKTEETIVACDGKGDFTLSDWIDCAADSKSTPALVSNNREEVLVAPNKAIVETSSSNKINNPDVNKCSPRNAQATPTPEVLEFVPAPEMDIKNTDIKESICIIVQAPLRVPEDLVPPTKAETNDANNKEFIHSNVGLQATLLAPKLLEVVPSLKTEISDADIQEEGVREEDDDRDFLEDDFLDNLAVVDSCYSDPEDDDVNDEESSKVTSSPKNDVKVNDELKSDRAKNTERKFLKGSSSRPTADIVDHKLAPVSREKAVKIKDGDINSQRKSWREEYDGHASKECDVSQRREEYRGRKRDEARRSKDRDEARRSRERVNLRRSRERSDYYRSKERLDSGRSRERQDSRRSRERQDPRSSRDVVDPRLNRDKVVPVYRRSRERDYESNRQGEVDEIKGHELQDPRRNVERGRNYSSLRSTEQQKVPRDKLSTKLVVKKDSLILKAEEVVKVVKVVPTQNDDILVPPGTEDVLLPDESSVACNSSNIKKANETRAKFPELIPRLLSIRMNESQGVDLNAMTPAKRQRTESDDTELVEPAMKQRKYSGTSLAMSRERVERDQNRMSRELSIERLRERSPRQQRLHSSHEEKKRLHNERFNLYMERKRLERLEADLNAPANRYGHSTSRRQHSRSSERLSRRDYSRSRDNGVKRYADLSPVSGGRMSRHSELSFELSPVSSLNGSPHDHYRGRSFSPISSGSNLSRARSMVSISSEEEGAPRVRRRKRSPFWKEMERKLGITMTSAPPAGGDYLYPPGGQVVAQYQAMDVPQDMSAPPPSVYPPLNYPPPVTFPPPHQYYAAPPPTTVEPFENRRQLVPLTAAASPCFTFKRAESQSGTQPEAPPPPQISGGSGEKMSLSSFLEASVRVGACKPDVTPERVARCNAAIEALRVDNVLSVISSGRFIVQPCANLLQYTTKTRFDHPAQESMIKLKSPLLRNTPVKLTYSNPPVNPSNAVTNPQKVMPTTSQKLTLKKTAVSNQQSVQKKNTPQMGNQISAQQYRSIPTTNQQNKSISTTHQQQPQQKLSNSSANGQAKAEAMNVSDPDITIIAEVPKSGNVVIATLDLVDEVTSVKCASCTKRDELQTHCISTQTPEAKDSRTVQTQAEFVYGVLRASCLVVGPGDVPELGTSPSKRKRNRNRMSKRNRILSKQGCVVIDGDESASDSDTSDAIDTNVGVNVQTLQSDPSESVPTTKDSNNSYNTFSFSKGVDMYQKKSTSGVTSAMPPCDSSSASLFPSNFSELYSTTVNLNKQNPVASNFNQSSSGKFTLPTSGSGNFSKAVSTPGNFNKPNPTAGTFNQPSSGNFSLATSGNFSKAVPMPGNFNQPNPTAGTSSRQFGGNFSLATSGNFNKTVSTPGNFNKPTVGNFNPQTLVPGNVKTPTVNTPFFKESFRSVSNSSQSSIFNTTAFPSGPTVPPMAQNSGLLFPSGQSPPKGILKSSQLGASSLLPKFQPFAGGNNGPMLQMPGTFAGNRMSMPGFGNALRPSMVPFGQQANSQAMPHGRPGINAMPSGFPREQYQSYEPPPTGRY